LQRAKLFDHQKPEDNAGPARAEQILWPVSEAHATQRSEIIESRIK